MTGWSEGAEWGDGVRGRVTERVAGWSVGCHETSGYEKHGGL